MPVHGSSRGPEEGDDGQDPAVVVAVRCQAELVEDRGGVTFHALRAEIQAGGDAGVGTPFGHQSQHGPSRSLSIGTRRAGCSAIGPGAACDRVRGDGVATAWPAVGAVVQRSRELRCITAARRGYGGGRRGRASRDQGLFIAGCLWSGDPVQHGERGDAGLRTIRRPPPAPP